MECRPGNDAFGLSRAVAAVIDKAGILRGHRGAVTHAAFSPDGSRILTASSDNTARLWNLVEPDLQKLIDLAHKIAPYELTEEERRDILKE